jgi:dipeptidase
LKTQKGQVSTESMMAILRSHRGTDESWTPDVGITGADVCMHAGWGPARGSQTTASMVTVLKKGQPPVHWLTGTAAPCTSLFKPVWMDCGIPETGLSPAGTYNSASLYWRHEALHREILRDYSSRIRAVKAGQVDFEKKYRHLVSEVSSSDMNERRMVTDAAFRDADALEEGWMRTVKETGISRQNTVLYRNAWKQFNKEAGMN